MGGAKTGRPARTYIQQLCEDTGCSPGDLPEAMNDREDWRRRVRDILAGGMTWWWWWLLRITDSVFGILRERRDFLSVGQNYYPLTENRKSGDEEFVPNIRKQINTLTNIFESVRTWSIVYFHLFTIKCPKFLIENHTEIYHLFFRFQNTFQNKHSSKIFLYTFQSLCLYLLSVCMSVSLFSLQLFFSLYLNSFFFLSIKWRSG